MVSAAVAQPKRKPGAWSLAALALSAAGVVAVGVAIAAAERVEGVFLPLVVAPLAISLAPVVVPSRAVRIGAAVVLGAWCVLTGFTIGFLFLPALAAQIGAGVRETE